MIRSIPKKIRTAILPVLCCSLMLVFAHSANGQAPTQTPSKTGTLTVKVMGIRNTQGNIRIAVRTDENTMVAGKIVDIDPKTLTAQAVFENLPEGSYGVAVIHDENKNEKLDFNEVGMPLEGYGHSNNPAKRPGPPDFNETKFAFAPPTATVEIALIYWP